MDEPSPPFRNLPNIPFPEAPGSYPPRFIPSPEQWSHKGITVFQPPKENLMKMVISLIMFLTSFSLTAETSEAPAYLKDAQITVTLANGTVYTFSANEFKVVPRTDLDTPDVVAIVEKSSEATKEAVLRKVERKNRLSLIAGVGYNGIEDSQNSTGDIRVREKRTAVVGIAYGRKFYKDFSLTGTLLSNESFTLGLGLDY